MGLTGNIPTDRMALGRLRHRLLVGALLLGAVMAAMAAPRASAAAAPEFLLQFGASGTAAGSTASPTGVAADPATGHVYISDLFNNRIDEFTSWGVFVKAWGWGVDSGVPALQTCTAASSCQEGTSGPGKGELNSPFGIAVDSSHNVYVVDRGNNRVQKFNSAGEFQLMFGKGVNTGSSGNAEVCTDAGPPTDICGAGTTGTGPGQFSAWPEKSFISVGPGDKVYVGDNNRIQRFSSSGIFEAEIALTGKGQTEALAVNSTGDFYVVSQNVPGKVSRYDSTGAPKNFTAGPGAGTNALTVASPEALAVNSADGLYVISGASNPNVLGFNPDGSEMFPALSAGVVSSRGIATNPKGDLYVSDVNFTASKIRAFGPEPDYELPPDVAPGIGDEYVTSVGPASAVVNAEISPHFWATHYYVQYGTAACVESGWGSACVKEQPTPPGPTLAAKRSPGTVAVTLENLSAHTAYRFRFVAESGAPSSLGNPTLGAERTIVTPQAGLAGLPDGRVYELVSPLDKENAEVAVPGNAGGQAQFSVKPMQASADGEAVTYASFTSFGDAEGAPLAGQYLSRRGSGGWSTENLSPRFEEGYARDPLVGFSPDLADAAVISINPPLSSGAPKNTWNLYSRSNPVGELETLTRGKPEVAAGEEYCVGYAGASANFDRVILVAGGKLTEEGTLAKGFNLYEWHRQASDSRQALTVKATGGEYTLTATNARGEGTLVSGSPVLTGVEVTSATGAFHVGDAISGAGIPSGAKITAVGATTLTLSASATVGGNQVVTATETTVPLSAGVLGANAADVQAALQALSAVGAGNVAVTGGPGDATGSKPFAIAFTGALAGTPVPRLQAVNISLSGGSPSSSAAAVSADPGGHLRLASVLPDGTATTPSATTSFGASFTPAKCNMEAGLLRHAISASGSRMFWTYGGTISLTSPTRVLQSPLFARVDGPSGIKTVQLDALQGIAGSVSGNGKYQDASVDGSKVFFIDNTKLTPAPAAAGDLYRYNVKKFEEGNPEPLTNLTAHVGEAAKVQGVLGVSEKGDYAYFVATGSLTATPNVRGELPVPTGSNLYAWHEGDAEPHFIATLGAGDASDWTTQLSKQTARVSPDGRHLAFLSEKSLTKFDNRVIGTPICQGSSSLCTEVYLYDFESQELACASCNPSGARPAGTSSVPTWRTPYEQPRYLLNDGRAFFESVDALDPLDTNHKRDVYEFEPADMGSCTTGSPTYSEASGGCIDLISTGSSGDASYLLDASTDGRDVFLATRQQLVPQLDKDTVFDVYDARVGGSPYQPPEPACEGEGCRGAGTAASATPSPGTPSFIGPGNETRRSACPKGKVRREGRCVRKKHHHKRATHKNRRTSR
jgi:hypothetical protein